MSAEDQLDTIRSRHYRIPAAITSSSGLVLKYERCACHPTADWRACDALVLLSLAAPPAANVAELVDWIADTRAEYATGPAQHADVINAEVRTTHIIADILRFSETAAGWLPSWRWDDYNTRHAALFGLT